MALSKKDVLKVALLSRIHLSEAEVEKFSSQLSAILDYVDKLRELDTANVEPLAHALAIHNVLREDEPKEGLSPEQALSGAPDSADDFFRVPRVLDEGASA
jgi:aspartyl-tRNA(Asn)/glutamyl-tRNA(Gln) amidotransferase subunit C